MATAISYVLACVILLAFYIPWSGISLGNVLIPKAEDFRYFWGVTWHILDRITGRGRNASS